MWLILANHVCRFWTVVESCILTYFKQHVKKNLWINSLFLKLLWSLSYCNFKLVSFYWTSNSGARKVQILSLAHIKFDIFWLWKYLEKEIVNYTSVNNFDTFPVGCTGVCWRQWIIVYGNIGKNSYECEWHLPCNRYLVPY